MNIQQVVHPAAREVPVAGGQFKVLVSPWTMAQRAFLKPKILSIVNRANLIQRNAADFKLSDLFDQFEEELLEIAKASVKLPDGAKWDDLLWEDLPLLVQAIWEVCVVRGEAGIAGKVAGALGKALNALLVGQLSQSPTPKPSPVASSEGSASSPDAGAPTQSASATL